MLASILGDKKNIKRLFWKNSWDSLTQNEKRKSNITLRITILFFPVQRNLREQNTTTTRFPLQSVSGLSQIVETGQRGKKKTKTKKTKKRRTPLTKRLEQAISPNVVAILNLPTAAVLFLIQPQISTCSVNGLVFSCYRLADQEVIYFK